MPSTYPESNTVRRSLDDSGVLLLTLDRPDRNNAWTIEMEEEFFGSLLAASEDEAVRVIVVTGAGKSFCPGLDMAALAESSTAGKPISSLRRWPMTLSRSIPKPVIAAINGAAAGIGMIQACCADIRFAASTAKFTTSFARRGLPAENGLSWLLPRLVGTGNAMDLLLSGRVVLAPEALELGLINRMVDPDDLLDATLAYARELAEQCSPFSMAAIKTQVHEDLERGAEDARLRAAIRIAEHTTSADFAEGVASFTERRAPNFPGYRAEVNVTRLA